MSRYHSYINSAEKIIQQYKAEIPFAIFIKQYFASEKKYGSKDRKQISNLCYNYFRLGKALQGETFSEKVITATFLCSNAPSEFLQQLHPEWNLLAAESATFKIDLLKQQFDLEDIFPFPDALSATINLSALSLSFLVQPATFLRLRPGYKGTGLKKMKKALIDCTLIGEDCIMIETGVAVNDFFLLDKEAVIQDYNSQKVLHYLQENKIALASPENTISVWDSCAASGGKSMLLFDILKGKLDLTVSDIRASIMFNLQQRFKRAGINTFKYFIADVANKIAHPLTLKYDLIICDAPCSGSGTWGRSPEQMLYFNPSKIQEYQDKQKSIVDAAIPHLKLNGLLVYITCSVFKKENEDIVTHILSTTSFQLLHAELLVGYDKRADSMFTAVFKSV